jgi:hypothetical protein
MKLSPALVLAPPDEELTKKQRNLLALLVLVGLYLYGHTVVRWVGYTLWYADDFSSTWETTFGETAYQVYMAGLPLLVWGLVFYAAARRFPRILNTAVILLLILLCLGFVEADMHWYQQSRRHVSWADIQAFASLDLKSDMGLGASNYWRFAGLMGAHAVCFGFLCLLAPRLARSRVFRGLTRVRGKVLALALACLIAVDVAVVYYFGRDFNAEDGYSQWRELARANPLRLRFLDDLFAKGADRISGRGADLEAANDQLASLPSSGPEGRRAERSGRSVPVRFQDPPNVVFITVESLNFQVAAETDLPYFQGFARRCLRLHHHYSTGNCTHYGILGMMYGSPVTFFQGSLSGPGSPSPYLELFAAHGYKSRLISTRLLDHHALGDYLPNFTEPTFVGATDRSLVPEFRREMARKGPRFTFLFYLDTHFPYNHSSTYSKYVPEVADDFDLFAWDVLDYRVPIVNRYKNCLVEWDAWLKDILGAIDLTRTIVVLAGDHGEDLLQDRRLGHGTSFSNHQTRIPCLIYIPAVAGRDVTTLTSHADLMPSLVDVLGWQAPAKPGLGKSIFQPGTRFAAIANQNYRQRPLRWAVLTEGCKTILEGDTAADLRISSLLDWKGQGVSFLADPARWTANFQAVKKVQAELP